MCTGYEMALCTLYMVSYLMKVSISRTKDQDNSSCISLMISIEVKISSSYYLYSFKKEPENNPSWGINSGQRRLV